MTRPGVTLALEVAQREGSYFLESVGDDGTLSPRLGSASGAGLTSPRSSGLSWMKTGSPRRPSRISRKPCRNFA
jgi:hypothetical protein